MDFYWLFAAWLVEHEKYEVVGTRGSICNCPLASFFRSTGIDARVLHQYLSVEDQSLTVKLPSWAVEFITLIDGDTRENEIFAHSAWHKLMAVRHVHDQEVAV